MRFVAIRFSRLWPLHIAALALFLALPGNLLWHIHNVSPEIWLENLTLMQSWIPLSDHYFSLNSPSWSISDEMFFYAAFVIICVRAKRAPILVALSAIALLAVYMSFVLALNVGTPLYAGIYAVNPIVRLPEFMVGVVLCEALNRLPYKNLSAPVWTGLECITILVVAANSLLIPSIAHRWYVYAGSGWSYYVATAGACPSFALLIAVFSASKGGIARFLSLRQLVVLGNVSFAVYLVHDPILDFARTRFLGTAPSVKFISASITILSISFAFHYFIEIPIYSRARKIIEASFNGGTKAGTVMEGAAN